MNDPESRRITVDTLAGPVAVDISINWANVATILGKSAATNKAGESVISRDALPLITAVRADKPRRCGGCNRRSRGPQCAACVQDGAS